MREWALEDLRDSKEGLLEVMIAVFEAEQEDDLVMD